MKCQECQERPATVRLVRIVGGQKTEQYLCQECAQERGEVAMPFQPQFPFGNLLVGMMGDEWWSGPRKAPVTSVRCEECGLTHEEFSRTGLLGCGECYHALARVVDPILARVHGHSRHTGKTPRRARSQIAVDERLDELRRQLEDLVRREEFEQAAMVRDRIREIEASRRREGESGEQA